MPAPCTRSCVTAMPDRMMSQRPALRPGISDVHSEVT